MRFPTRIALAFAVALVTPALAQPRPEPTPAFTASYRAESVSVRSETVDLDFSSTIFNIGKVEAEVDAIRLASPSAALTPFAEFDGVTIAPGSSASISGRVTISAQEWRRWEAGGPATLFLFVRRASGDVGRTRIEAYRAPGGR